MQISILYYSGEYPNLPDLLQLDILQVVDFNYEMFGVLLLEDKIGYRIGVIVDECRGNPQRIIRSILKEWLKGKGKPVTWQALIDTLRTCKHSDLADRIQNCKYIYTYLDYSNFKLTNHVARSKCRIYFS